MILLEKEAVVSKPFTIPFGGQLTLLATGLAVGEFVDINIVTMTSSGDTSMDPCCPGAVTLPEVEWSFKLLTLTHEKPWAVIDKPQIFSLQAVLTADEDAVVRVYVEQTDSRCCSTGM